MILIKFLFIFYLINQINCLFEDQAGTYDWRQQYVGRPLFSRIDSTRNKIYLATDQRLLCALNKKTGNIVWRKLFENNNQGDIDFVLWAQNEIVLINSNGKHVQAFNYNHGYLTLEFLLFKNASAGLSYNGFESKIESEAYYLTNGYELCYINSKDRSCTDLPTELGHVFNNIYETEQGVFAIGINDHTIVKLQFNGLLNSQLSKSVYELPSKSNIECYTVEGAQLNCLINNDEVHISDIKVSNLQFNSYKLLFKLSDNRKLVFKSSKNLVVHDNSNLYFFELNKESPDAKLIRTIDDFVSYYTTSHEDEKLLVVTRSIGNKLNFYAYSIRTGNERTDFFTTVTQNDQKSVLYVDGSVDSKSRQPAISHFSFYEDHSMVLYSQNGNKVFTREEALASIISVEMIDFPLTTLQEEFEDEFGSSDNNLIMMFLRRLKSQLFQIKEAFGDLLGSLKPAKQNPNVNVATNELNKESLLKRDEFNLNKLIVAVTSVGKVFGIHSSNGQIIWSFYLSSSDPYLTNLDKQHVPLFVQRTAAHYPYDAQCAIISKLKSDNSKTIVTFFNPLNGVRVKEYRQNDLVLDFKVKQVFLANIADGHFLKPLVLLDSENKVHVLPKSSEELIFKSKKPYVIYIAEKNSLSGYSIKSSQESAIQLWSINLEDEIIVSIGAKLHNDRVHSHGKVLGDRSVLYKYLNPNMIAVATEGLDNQKVPYLNLYIVDTVNGQIITSFNHKRTRGPVHIAHSENWFFYSYYNLKYRRHEVTSIELFEGSTQYNSTHFSSFDAIKPVIFSKSYIVQKSFDAMQVTVTEKGITTKDIIVATPFGTLIEIPAILIDARRPLEMTEIDREENLIPYMPEIPLNYEFSLNYYNYVYNIRGIATSQSGLESTSLVFAYGLDIFFTRVFPSKTFDMLREDFDYFFIIALLFGLLLGALISKKLASSSNLSKAWK